MVTFILRDYPDLDHIFPIIHYFLEKKQKINIINYEINLNLENDPRVVFLKKNYKDLFEIYEIYRIPGKRFFLDRFINFLSSKKFKGVNFKTLKKIDNKRNILNLFFLFFICVFKKIIFSSNNIFEKFIFNDSWAKNIINHLSITSLVLDDSFYLNHSRPQSLIKNCKLKNIKITLVPHTCYMFTRSEDYQNLKAKNFKKFYPNIVVTSLKMKSFLIGCGIDPSKIKNLGSARFSETNIINLNAIFKKQPKTVKVNNSNKKLRVLYIDGVYDENIQKKKLINAITKLKFVELIVKAHPRGMFSPLNDKNKSNINDKSITDFYEIDISSPTKTLIENSDVILCTYSSILIEAMLLYKKIILPKFLLNKKSNFDIFYEDYNFANVHFEINQVISFLESLNKKENKVEENKSNVDKFVSEFVYGGNIDSTNIINSYYELIK